GLRDGRGKCRQLRFGGGPVGVPSRLTSPRAITPRQGGKPGNVSRRSTSKVAPLTQRDRATPGQTGWNTRPPHVRRAEPNETQPKQQQRTLTNDTETLPQFAISAGSGSDRQTIETIAKRRLLIHS